MGLFSNIFKPRAKKIVETQLGIFTLVHSKGKKNIWNNTEREFLLSVRGTETEPDSVQIEFFRNINIEISKLDTKITRRFITEFRDADLEVAFKNWHERFKLVAVDVMLVFQEEGYWNITFEDLKEPYAHFTLYIEGEKTTDFSIDT